MNTYPSLPQPDSWVGFSKMFGEETMKFFADAVLSMSLQWLDMESVPRNRPVLLVICVSNGRGHKWEMQVCEIRDDGRVCDAIHSDNTGWDFEDYQGWQELPAPPQPEIDE